MALRHLQPSLRHTLRSLTVSSLDLSSVALRTLLVQLPHLTYFNANNSPIAFNDETFLSLANLCPNLTHLHISATSLTTKSLSNPPTLPLQTLSLASVVALTDASVSTLCNTYPTLTHLHLANNPKLTTLSLPLIATLPLTSLTVILPKTTPTLPHLSTLLTSLSPTLTSLSIPYTFLNTHRTEKPTLLTLFSLLTRLTHLEFSHITSTTPNNIIYNIVTSLATRAALKSVVLRRETYERDWIVTGMYADVREGFLVVDEAFVERVRGVVGERCTVEFFVQD
ncbi:hypothetical protein HDV00_005428 [Rhizophlyctis rosea]|nr:hypothetical protein HDV00_005428 [Rhizophlyctis rosea]